MAKLMEIIEKNPNFEKGTVTLKLLDTNFTQLTRKIGNNPTNYHYLNAKPETMLSKQLLVSLNQDQLKMIALLNRWLNAVNNQIDIYNKTMGNLSHFIYNFTSLIDYSSKYVPNQTLADYYLLTEFVNAEKEMYEFGRFWGAKHIYETGQKMKEWSKNRDYGSCVGSIYCQYEIRDGWDYKWQLYQNTHNLDVKIEHEGGRPDFCDMTVSGLTKIPVGETAVVIARADWKYKYDYNKTFNFWAHCIMKITRNKLGVDIDDGRITFKAEGDGNEVSWYENWGDGSGTTRWVTAFDNIRRAPRINSRSGKGSPHFDYDTKDGKPLTWLKSRVIL
ncbi:hypothetical protein [Fusobacterium perfoetens]|uniref:hypothetical protein n=1 Tax=Fusobacterium perfoetens TaxID=852 RepID=UPI001F389237|nr:hypothetical protein [Fusobacterium perfoetens]MCF2611647.1 hypothetical protein [Fusobacterium perfoetens]